MFADVVQVLAAALGVLWVALVAGSAAARRRRVAWRGPGVAVLACGGVAATAFAAHAVLGDHLDDAGAGPTRTDTAIWAYALDHRTGATTAAAAVLRVAGGTLALTALAAVAGALLLWRGRRLDAALVVSAPLVSTVLGDVAKLGYGRPRPPVADQLIPESGFSLPSGHTVDATIVLGVLALVVVSRARGPARRLVVATVAAVLVAAAGAARVYLGVHWATDIVSGWLLGAAWIAVCATTLLVAGGRSGAAAPRATRPSATADPDDRPGPATPTASVRFGAAWALNGAAASASTARGAPTG